MRQRILLILSIVLSIYSGAFAGEKIYIDNEYIQQYRGKLGCWMMFESRKKLQAVTEKYGISIQDVDELNGPRYRSSDYIFIPFSETYLQNLGAKGITREESLSKQDEFIWPLAKAERISSPFGIRWGQLHTGADMPATKGSIIVAAMDGKIVYTGYAEGHGKTIYVEHRNNFFTRYSHNSVILIKNGDYVRKGQIIGFVGSTGNSTGNHLHFEIRYNDIPLNPLDFLPPRDDIPQAHMFRHIR